MNATEAHIHAATRLGLPLTDVRVITGDGYRQPMVEGTVNGRTIQVLGDIDAACDCVRDALKAIEGEVHD